MPEICEEETVLFQRNIHRATLTILNIANNVLSVTQDTKETIKLPFNTQSIREDTK